MTIINGARHFGGQDCMEWHWRKLHIHCIHVEFAGKQNLGMQL